MCEYSKFNCLILNIWLVSGITIRDLLILKNLSKNTESDNSPTPITLCLG